MFRVWFSALAVSWALLCAPVHAQTQYAGQGIPVTDPDRFAATLAQQVMRDRMTPLRRTLLQMLGTAELSADLEVAFSQMERFLGTTAGAQPIELEDISLAGTLRRIYYLNPFGNSFLFTRYDFIRGPDGWVLTGITFGTSWNQVNATPVTPGWTVTQ